MDNKKLLENVLAAAERMKMLFADQVGLKPGEVLVWALPRADFVRGVHYTADSLPPSNIGIIIKAHNTSYRDAENGDFYDVSAEEGFVSFRYNEGDGLEYKNSRNAAINIRVMRDTAARPVRAAVALNTQPIDPAIKEMVECLTLN